MSEGPNFLRDTKFLGRIMKIYREGIKNVPILKYSWILIVTIGILSLAGYLKLKNSDVFFYAFIVLILCFLGFVFSFLTKAKDIVIRVALYLIVYVIAFSISTGVGGFAYFVLTDKPNFYKRYFPDQTVEQKAGTTSEDKVLPSIELKETSQAVHKQTRKTDPPDSVKRTPTKLADGFHRDGRSGYLIYKGKRIKFVKVTGNSTKWSGAVSPYFISAEPITNQFLIDYSDEHESRTPTPHIQNRDKPIEAIFYDDAAGIAKMVGLKLPDMFQLVNAELSGAISTKGLVELFEYTGDSTANHPIRSQSSLGELTQTLEQRNIRYYSDKHHAEVKGNLMREIPKGRIRLVYEDSAK